MRYNEGVKRHSLPQFFFSILTACATGIGLSYLGIIGFEVIKSPQTVTSVYSRAKNLIGELSSKIVYEAEDVREEVGDDITFRGEEWVSDLDASSAAISALAYSVESLDKNNILLEKDADRLLPIASLTKLVTAVLARNLFNTNDTINITSNALATEGNTGRFKLNEKIKVNDILYPLLMVSSNDAAEALREAYDKEHGAGEFVKKMNDWANSIGAYRTYFKDASGLSPQNVSTAHDLSIIARWIKEHDPEIFTITRTKTWSIRGHTWSNPTHFLSLSSYVGGKNGYTPEASLTSVSLFTLGDPGREYAVVLLGSRNRDKDTLAVLNQAVK
jgi:D-alanyl-D-alanine carboxypeptidase